MNGFGSSLLTFGQQQPGMAFGSVPATPPGTPVLPANAFAAMPEGGFDLSFGGAPGAVPGMAGAGGSWFDKIGGLEGIGQITQGLASLGQIYGAWKGLGLAEDQFDFAKQAYQTNLTNSRRAYNTSLEDRIRSRAVVEGQPAGYVQSYLDKHSL